MRTLLLLIISGFLVVNSACSSQFDDLDISEFLGPPVGTDLLLISPDGLSVNIKGLSGDGVSYVQVEDIYHIEQKHLPDGFPSSMSRKYKLMVSGKKMIMETPKKNVVAFQKPGIIFGKSWTVYGTEAISEADDLSSEFGTAKASPLEFTCRIAGFKEQFIAGKKRNTVTVECSGESNFGEQIVFFTTFASGLGKIEQGGYSILEDGKKMDNPYHLVLFQINGQKITWER